MQALHTQPRRHAHVGKLFISAALVAAGLMMGLPPRAAAQAQAQAARCSLGHDYPVSSVEEYHNTTGSAFAPTRNRTGAELYVAAQPGLTAEWLQRVVEQDMASGACDFGARNAVVEVMSAGNGFWVRVTSTDANGGDRILQRARAMRAPATAPAPAR